MQNVLLKRNVKMGLLLTGTALVRVQVNIQGNIVEVRVLQLHTIQTTHILYNMYKYGYMY